MLSICNTPTSNSHSYISNFSSRNNKTKHYSHNYNSRNNYSNSRNSRLSKVKLLLIQRNSKLNRLRPTLCERSKKLSNRHYKLYKLSSRRSSNNIWTRNKHNKTRRLVRLSKWNHHNLLSTMVMVVLWTTGFLPSNHIVLLWSWQMYKNRWYMLQHFLRNVH